MWPHVAGSAALVGQGLSIRHQRRISLRREQIDLVSRFWEAVDRLWESSVALADTIFAIQASRQAGHHDSVSFLDEQRLSRIVDKKKAAADVRVLIAQMRLLHPEVVPAAEELRAASEAYRAVESEQCRLARQSALDAFEGAARRMLRTSSSS